MKKILAIGDHFDDIELAAAGTLNYLSNKGAEVFKITLTDNVTKSKELKLKEGFDGSKLINALEKKRIKSSKKNKGLVLIADEFGKYLEHASNKKSTDELYLIQQTSLLLIWMLTRTQSNSLACHLKLGIK